jgi:hypothetical protein
MKPNGRKQRQRKLEEEEEEGERSRIGDSPISSRTSCPYVQQVVCTDGGNSYLSQRPKPFSPPS